MFARPADWRALLGLGMWTAGLFPGTAGDARAQTPRPPDAGGRTGSLGQPLLWHWQLALGTGVYFDTAVAPNVMVRVAAGAYHPLLNPVTKLAEIGTEVYLGARGKKGDGGVRGLLRVPYFSAGIGADYNLRDRRVDMLVTLNTPVRRGGFVTRGSLLRLDWYPLANHTFTFSVAAPLGDRLAGRNRPIRDYVVVAPDFYSPVPYRATNGALTAILDSLRTSAEWIRRLTVPFLDQDGRDASVGVARTVRYVAELQAHLAVRSVDAEVRLFHHEMQRAFAVAARAPPEELAQHCRDILLDEVLFPYDRLLGRKKHHDSLKEFSMAARGRFSRWVVSSGTVAPDRTADVLFVFESLTDILEGVRHRAAKEWDDARLAWLPLQYALLPEDHDEQAELDALIERATGVSFTDDNHVSYVANLQFHWELRRMLHETRDYHVLWIHDFPAVTSTGGLDWASFEQVVDGYLAALAERVEAYDSIGRLPSFFIFLDQHYYELRKSRMLMTVLEDPLHASAKLPAGSDQDRARLARSLERLRLAVTNSRVLQAEAREYGDAWLRNRVSVHINITNRVDASFWGGGLVSSVFGYPDDVMRDHRKIAFRDVSEDDPARGVALITGTGVGQQYLGPGWDDRSLIVHGPVLRQLKAAARDLLLTQGLTEAELPPPLRLATPVAGRVALLAARSDATRVTGRALALVNGTGYLPKSLDVGKALLYSLMPAGSVIKVPDSLWNSTFYAALLVGASLRGAHVLIIAPALANAPSNGFPQMSRAQELFTRLLVVRGTLGPAITGAGGDLRIGLYALPADEHGFASRADRWARQVDASPFLQRLWPFAPAILPIVAQAGRDSSRFRLPGDTVLIPKLHQKVQFFATRQFWDGITSSPEWPAFMAAYLRYRRATYSLTGVEAEGTALPDSLEQIAERLLAQGNRAPRAASFAMVGSQNQDYRGMFMDGEVGVLFTGAESLLPLVDLVFMAGTVTWIDDQATLDRLLPPVGEFRRRVARIAKDGV